MTYLPPDEVPTTQSTLIIRDLDDVVLVFVLFVRWGDWTMFVDGLCFRWTMFVDWILMDYVNSDGLCLWIEIDCGLNSMFLEVCEWIWKYLWIWIYACNVCNVDGNGNGIKWSWVGPLVYLIFSGPRKFSAASKKPPKIVLYSAAMKKPSKIILFSAVCKKPLKIDIATENNCAPENKKAAVNSIIFGSWKRPPKIGYFQYS